MSFQQLIAQWPICKWDLLLYTSKSYPTKVLSKMSIFVYPIQSSPKAEFLIAECSTFCIILCWNQSASRCNAFLAKEEQNKNVRYFYVATQRTKWQSWFTFKDDVHNLVQVCNSSWCLLTSYWFTQALMSLHYNFEAVFFY